MFDEVKNKNISQIVIEQIQDMILTGALISGDKLPPERELTEELGISRPVLREALKALEAIGLIERHHAKGNYVSSNVENSFYKPLSLCFKLYNGNIEEILSLRELIENHTVKEASAKATQDDVNKLYDIHNKMIQEPSNNRKAYYDKALHYEIAKISGNKLIVSILESISYLMDTFIDNSVKVSLFEENSIKNLYDEHLNIIKSIENHDQESAVQAMAYHLNKIDLKLIKELRA